MKLFFKRRRKSLVGKGIIVSPTGSCSVCVCVRVFVFVCVWSS